MVPFKSFDAVVYISSVHVFSFLSVLPLVLLCYCFPCGWKTWWNYWKCSGKGNAGEQESHSFWSEGSAAEQLWSLSWAAPSFWWVWLLPFAFLTHRAFDEVWRQQRREATEQPSQLCFKWDEIQVLPEEMSWAEQEEQEQQSTTFHTQTELGKASGILQLLRNQSAFLWLHQPFVSSFVTHLTNFYYGLSQPNSEVTMGLDFLAWRISKLLENNTIF